MPPKATKPKRFKINRNKKVIYRKFGKKQTLQLIDKVLNKRTETKVVNYRANARDCLNVQSVNWVNSVLNMIPGTAGGNNMFNISQGDGQGQRTGNQISPVGLYLRGIVRAQPSYDLTLNYNPSPMYVTMYIMKIKKHLSDSSSELETIIDNTAVQNGSTSIGFSGLPNDMLNTINSDVLTCLYKRTFKVGNAQYVSNFGVNAPANAAQQYANNDFPLMQMFKLNLTKFLPKKMKFNDTSDICTNTRKLWFFFCVTRQDNSIPVTGGSPQSTTGPVPAVCELSADFYFKDG